MLNARISTSVSGLWLLFFLRWISNFIQIIIWCPNDQNLFFWLFGSFRNAFFLIFEWSFMIWWGCRMLKYIRYYNNRKQQVNPTAQNPENVEKPLLWRFGSFKNAFQWFLNDPSWPGKVVKSWKTFSTITICNIKSIQQTKVQKTAKNLFFDSLDHSKMHFCDIWMILHDLVMLPNVGIHLVLS